jgi:DNA invertase Pin-like site-specific DNA recombinase
VTVKDSLFKYLNLVISKVSIDKENDVKYLLDQSKPYSETALEYGVSKAIISRIKAQNDPNRPCSEPGRPKILKNRDVARLVRLVTLGAVESVQKASYTIETTLGRPVSRSTLSRALQSAGLHAKKKLIKPTLTDRQSD